ncbi:vacuolar protein sorting/targeting protein 10 [Amniculicola lignicola CBS 123094]|uniref:Vacuolar protein sorting/targeting protein 10 n=1 Tax=Amniculicola lignicola CBS 123094 TaxID=1392246 RepID=A0A6A5W4Q4_9PLEO|nr:vacuolar protein sorting/targeting protein 10 [Amniculicola lignicola CBS 123094]
MKYLRGILLPAIALALAPLVAAKKDGPLVKTTTFDQELVNLVWFDDSEVVLADEIETGAVYRSTDAGKKWEKLKDMVTVVVIKNPYDKKVAVALGPNRQHQITYDQGETWDQFETKLPITGLNAPLSWHSGDSKKIIVNTVEDCWTAPCLGMSWYTTDGFKTPPKLVREDRKMCIWAKSSERFLLGKDVHDDKIICITAGKYSQKSSDFRLLMSDKFFKDEEEPVMSSGRTVAGFVNMAVVKGYLVAAAKSDHSKELALYVTDDTDTWHRALFGDHKIEENAYTILESTNYSIQVDVMTQKRAFVGALYSSNSNGTYFTKKVDYTNRNEQGFVDFEKVAGVQGCFLVNIIDNGKDITGPNSDKKLKSQITFDDGRTFEALKTKEGKDLHLHSVTNLHNSGRVFSSPAPGVVMGVGNTGDRLGAYTDGDLYVSDDAGLTWTLALTDAHKYEFGNQGAILVAVFDEGETDKVEYSIDHGKKWESVKLPDEVGKIRARELTTVPDSTSLKFILYGSKKKEKGGRDFIMVHLDFAELHERQCEKGDFEKWSARKDDKGKDMCVMGQKQYYRRRKADVDCFIAEDFKEPEADFDPCDCDEEKDYECDFNFKPEQEDGKAKNCVPAGPLELPGGACKDGAKTFKGSSGWRKIPGNGCKGDTKKDAPIERDCTDTVKAPASGEITKEVTNFKGKNFLEFYYLERGRNIAGTDETVIMLTSEREAWISHNHGKEWKLAVDAEIVQIYPHLYINDRAYLITPSEKVYYTMDRGLKDSFKSHTFNAPNMPNLEGRQILQFHPKNEDWLIWVGGENCKDGKTTGCHTAAHFTPKNGGEWKALLKFVKKCAFVWREAGRHVAEELVFCEQHIDEEMANPLELITSEDWFAKKDVKFKSVVEFATMGEFIVVATKGDDGKSLKLDASLDGSTFADAKFPSKLNVDHQTAYTVLESSTHSIFLHVTVNPTEGQEYGAIIKSNSNGTSYVMSLANVNRNTPGYVDFEKMQGIEGVALASIVANVEQVNGGAKKKLQSKITHNDAADWTFMEKVVDKKDKPITCKGEAICALHIHGYTERRDPRETYSSPTAVGVMMAVGNVGEYLTTFEEASTFITTDAGITWKLVMEGNFAWEFGDQGSVIVIVKRGLTKNLFYSLDNGDNWEEYQFADHDMTIDTISTVPSDTSLNFLLWGADKDNKLTTVNVDFSGLKQFEKKCELVEEDPTGGDYTLFTPQHPVTGDECLFGHVAQYHRKKDGVNCRNGERIDHLHNISKNCTCQRRDFECDFNFERHQDGSCHLVEGLTPADPKAVCAEAGVEEYWDITGYRKIPISTCEGGNDMSETSQVYPCPGFEKQFEKKHGISGFGIFLAVVIPVVAAGGFGYYVWRNWDGKFGRIRLGDSTGYSSLDGDSPLIKWPVAAIAGLVAVVAAIPMLIGSLFRMVSGRFGSGGGGGYGDGYGAGRTYTSRSSFARGRGDYAVVDPDEGELLGEDSDEEV